MTLFEETVIEVIRLGNLQNLTDEQKCNEFNYIYNQKLQSLIQDRKIYCDIVDEKGHIFMTTKGLENSYVQTHHSFNTTLEIIFPLKVTKNDNIIPRKLLILGEYNGDIILIFNYNLLFNARNLLNSVQNENSIWVMQYTYPMINTFTDVLESHYSGTGTFYPKLIGVDTGRTA